MLTLDPTRADIFGKEEVENLRRGLTGTEAKPCLVPSSCERVERFRTLISTELIDRLLNVGGMRPETFRLVRNGDISRGRYLHTRRYSPLLSAEGAIDPELVYREYHRGASMLLTHTETCIEPIERLAHDLSAQLRCAVTVHAALTPPRGARALEIHYDTFDVVVLQIEGEKRWEVFAPRHELPLVFQRFSSYGEPPDERAAPLLDVVLRPGDMLLLPRGYLHRAQCGDQHSLHLALNFRFATVYDVLAHAVDNALAQLQHDVTMRRVAAQGDGFASGLEQLLDVIRANTNLDDVCSGLARDVRAMTIGRLVGIHDAEQVGLLDEIRVTRPLVWCTRTMAEVGEAILLYVGNETQWLPSHFESALRVLRNGTQIQVRLLPALDPDEALLLARVVCVLGAGRMIRRDG